MTRMSYVTLTRGNALAHWFNGSSRSRRTPPQPWLAGHRYGGHARVGYARGKRARTKCRHLLRLSLAR